MVFLRVQDMFHVEKMFPKDFEFAARLSNTMNWDASEEDFEFNAKLEPEGCFVLYSDSEKVGITTAISFDQVGWLGNVIVSEEHRGKGGGLLMVEKAMEYLTNKGVKTIGLYSYVDRIPFYAKQGFRFDSKFVVMKGKGFSRSTKAHVRAFTANDEQLIFDMDRLCFGGSRSRLLEPILNDPANLCYVRADTGQLFGFAVAKVIDEVSEVGPLVCRREHSDVATDLLFTILSKLEGCEVSLCIPEKEAGILKLLKQHGFREHLILARLFRGTPIINDYIYIAESLERG